MKNTPSRKQHCVDKGERAERSSHKKILPLSPPSPTHTTRTVHTPNTCHAHAPQQKEHSKHTDTTTHHTESHTQSETQTETKHIHQCFCTEHEKQTSLCSSVPCEICIVHENNQACLSPTIRKISVLRVHMSIKQVFFLLLHVRISAILQALSFFGSHEFSFTLTFSSDTCVIIQPEFHIFWLCFPVQTYRP